MQRTTSRLGAALAVLATIPMILVGLSPAAVQAQALPAYAMTLETQIPAVMKANAIPGVVGSEFDAYAPRAAPPGVQLLAHSPVAASVAGPSHSDASWYTRPGGGGVFATGTARWVTSLWDGPPALDQALHFGVARQQPQLTAITLNVLRVLAGPPASRTHPSVANWQRFYRPDTPLSGGVDVS